MVANMPEVQDINIMEKMLEKGDVLRPKYDNFDFSKMDSSQLFWIRKLTWFTYFR